MPDTRGTPLPSEILGLLKDSSIQTWLRNFIVQVGSEMTIGRFPGRGSAQNDIYVYPDAADATHPYNFDYLIASNFQRIISAKLSFFVRPYRTYDTTTAATTSAGSAHSHTVSGQTASSTTSSAGSAHSHSIFYDNASSGVNTTLDAGGTLHAPGLGGVNAGTNTEGSHTHPVPATSVSGATSSSESTHTHTISISTTLGIRDGAAPVNPGITVSVDGSDITAAIGGPFNNNVIELDITQQLKTAPKIWHTLALQPNQNVRITGILRVSYYVDSRLAQ